MISAIAALSSYTEFVAGAESLIIFFAAAFRDVQLSCLLLTIMISILVADVETVVSVEDRTVF